MKMHFKNIHSGAIWPSDEIPQERIKKSTEENMGPARELSYSSIADEEGESEDTLEEVDLTSPGTSRNVVGFKLSLCRASTTNNLGLNYFPSAPAVASEKPIRTVFDTSQNLHLTHHVTEVIAVPTDVPAVSSACEGEHVTSVTEKRSDAPRKCSNWYCLHGKHPFQVTSLIILYLVIGVIFFPLLMLVFMICCVSYFTPDID